MAEQTIHETPEVAARGTLDRRTLLKSAAWAAPVIAVAVAAPAAAASAVTKPPVICGGGEHDNGSYTIQENADGTYTATVMYKQVPDIYEINVRLKDGSSLAFGTNYGTAPAAGSKVWSVVLAGVPSWMQVHTFNAHLGDAC